MRQLPWAGTAGPGAMTSMATGLGSLMEMPSGQKQMGMLTTPMVLGADWIRPASARIDLAARWAEGAREAGRGGGESAAVMVRGVQRTQAGSKRACGVAPWEQAWVQLPEQEPSGWKVPVRL